MLFVTTIARNIITPKYAILNRLCAILKVALSLLIGFTNFFSAKTKIKAIEKVMANFTNTKPNRFVFTKPAITGLSSIVPKYRVPITVVKQSMEPKKTRNKFGMVSVPAKIFSPLIVEKLNLHLRRQKLAEDSICPHKKAVLQCSLVNINLMLNVFLYVY